MPGDILHEALRNVRTHWLRVLLTGSGITWGIALFVALAALGNGTRAHYREKMETIGRKVIYAFPGVVVKPDSGGRAIRLVQLDNDDPPRLTASPLIEHSAGELWAGARVLKGGEHIKVVWTYGVDPDVARIRNFVIARGRFISPGDIAARRRVLVIGAKVEERLFGRASGLGRSVRLDGHRFRVVGVSTRKGQQMMNMGPNDDEQVLLPLTTAQTLFTGSDAISYVLYAPRERGTGPASIERVRTLLGQHHRFRPINEEAMSFFDIAEAVKLTEIIGIALQLFLAVCGALTLAAGGIGVMNIMLVAVTERTRELALRKAVGATQRDLFLQVLAETVLVTAVAGLVGLALGAGLIFFLRAIRGFSDQAQFLTPEITLTPDLAALSFVVLVGVGILAGLVPARRAARLDPAVALREE